MRNSEFGIRNGSKRLGESAAADHRRPPRVVADDNSVPRAGLAPLELVLSLFFLLLMMALIINFGTIASWRARGNTAARFAVWRTVGLRTGAAYPNPPNWTTQTATAGLLPGLPANPQTIGLAWNQGDLMQPALRGPAVVDPSSGNSFQVGNFQYVEMVNQMQIGSASLTKKMPLIPKLRQSSIKPMHPVLDPLWRFEDMSPKTNSFAMRNNGDWRAYQWYLFEPQQLGNGDLLNLYMQFQQADQKIQQNGGAASLLPLDRDDELTAWRGSPPDFYPRLNGCEILPSNVQMNLVSGKGGLISRIEGPNGGGRGGVPDQLSQAFLNMYNQQLKQAQQQQPPDQQLISQLQDKIQQMQQFRATLF